MKEWKKLIEPQGIAKEDIPTQPTNQKREIRKVSEANKKKLGQAILPNKNVKCNGKPGVNRKPNLLQQKTTRNSAKNNISVTRTEPKRPVPSTVSADKSVKKSSTKSKSVVEGSSDSTQTIGDAPNVDNEMSHSLVHQPLSNSDVLPPNRALPSVPDDGAPSKDLPPAPEEYSYASFEFRPMLVNNNGLLSSPVDDRSKPQRKPQGNYCYAAVTPRPVVVGMNDAVTIPVSEEKPDSTLANESDSKDGIDELHTSVNGDLYAVVERPPKYPGASKPAVPKNKPIQQKHTSTRVASPSAYDMVADPVLPNGNSKVNLEDLYAAVDYSQKRRVSTDASTTLLPKSNILFPPGFNPSSRRVSDGMLNTPYFPNTSGRKPPPMPRPYHQERKASLSPHIEERLDSRATRSSTDLASGYSEVTIDQTKRRLQGTLLHSNSTDSFNYRPSVAANDRLSKSQNTEQLSAIRKVRTHQRNRSHENVSIFRSMDSASSGGHSSALSDKSERLSNSSSSISKDSEDDTLPPRINENTLDYLSKVNTDTLSDELPEGWQAVTEGSETYYWHLWTGTIQYERPTYLMTPTPTPTSSSRSDSPFSGVNSANSSRAASSSNTFDFKLPATPTQRSDTPEFKAKQIISFPVHSMGWMEVDESNMGPKVIGETVNNCITTLAHLRHDLYNTSETWADGEDLKLILEGETLKLLHPETKHVYHVQPIAKMRVWGVGRDGEEKRDFAYIARDPVTQKHKCHMFRCHGHVSGRSVTNALQAICTRVLDEKRKAKEREGSAVKPTSDLMRPPSKTSGTNFNEKSYPDQKKCFTAKYVGSMTVTKPSGVDILNKAVHRLTDGELSSSWSSVLLEVTTSEIKTVDCVKQETIMEHRVRFITFLGVAHDEKYGAYIVAESKDSFACHVFFCAPHAGTLTKAIEEACKLRFEKMLDSQSVRRESSSNNDALKLQPVPNQQQQQQPQLQSQTSINSQRGSVKEKTSKLLSSSLAGVFSKFNKKDSRRKDSESPTNSRPSSYAPNPNEYVVRYFGAVLVSIGTGREPVESSVSQLSNGEAMCGYLEVEQDSLTISDAQRSATSQRVFDVSNISYCGMTSDRKFFGIIISRGKGKYMCHVFQEYEANTGVDIVDAIQNIL